MLTVAICDDNKRDLAHLYSALENCRGTREWTVTPFESPDALLAAAERDGPFDLYLLDVIMPGLTGLELMRRLKALTEGGPAVILLTSSREFAVDAFQLGALHYLLKPYTEEQLAAALDRALHYLAPPREEPFPMAVTTSNGVASFSAYDLLWVEVRNHTAHYHLVNGRPVVSRTLRVPFEKMAEELLANPQFYRCHQSFIINLGMVERVGPGAFYLRNGSTVPISRSHQRESENAWLSYLEVRPK